MNNPDDDFKSIRSVIRKLGMAKAGTDTISGGDQCVFYVVSDDQQRAPTPVPEPEKKITGKGKGKAVVNDGHSSDDSSNKLLDASGRVKDDYILVKKEYMKSEHFRNKKIKSDPSSADQVCSIMAMNSLMLTCTDCIFI